MTKKTDAQLITSNNTIFTTNNTQAISGYAINAFFQDLIDSKLSNNAIDTGFNVGTNQLDMYAGSQLIAKLQQGTLTGLRMYKPIYTSFGSAIASAPSMDIGVATGIFVNITGTGQTITTFGTNAIQGMHLWVKWAGANTITNNAAIICPGSANIVTAAGDKTLLVYNGSGIWEIWEHRRFATAP